LIKGGAGQAVQNMNLLKNFKEIEGLKWKSYWLFFFLP
jgi:N-acetyl-gamma-glutamylphosphate reductase